MGCGGLGVRILYERMKPKVDPLGPESMLGFVAGLLTGTEAPTASRYVIVAKSPYQCLGRVQAYLIGNFLPINPNRKIMKMCS
jgi:aldehyde:ferredoxin oxidoreductase